MDQVIPDGPMDESVGSVTLEIEGSQYEEEPWPSQMTGGGFMYLNAASCPDCGSGMVRLGSCFSCPICGWGGCGAS